MDITRNRIKQHIQHESEDRGKYSWLHSSTCTRDTSRIFHLKSGHVCSQIFSDKLIHRFMIYRRIFSVDNTDFDFVPLCIMLVLYRFISTEYNCVTMHYKNNN